MAGKHKAVRRPGKRVLTTIAEALEEIDAHFEGSGFSHSKVITSGAGSGEVVDAEPKGEDDNDYDESDHGETYEPEYFDREDIEVAIDEFISQIIKANIVRKAGGGQPPSFSDVFEKCFGDAHEITAKAQNFEEYVKGYFGAIAPEDMRAAYHEFREIQQIVQTELGSVDDIEK